MGAGAEGWGASTSAACANDERQGLCDRGLPPPGGSFPDIASAYTGIIPKAHFKTEIPIHSDDCDFDVVFISSRPLAQYHVCTYCLGRVLLPHGLESTNTASSALSFLFLLLFIPTLTFLVTRRRHLGPGRVQVPCTCLCCWLLRVNGGRTETNCTAVPLTIVTRKGHGTDLRRAWPAVGLVEVMEPSMCRSSAAATSLDKYVATMISSHCSSMLVGRRDDWQFESSFPNIRSASLGPVRTLCTC